MSDINQKDFEKAYCNMKAPDELKTDTLKRMWEENEERKTPEKSASRKKAILFRGFALATALCAAAVVMFLIQPKGATYVTPMEEGEYYDKVELKDGTICFVKNRVVISISPNAGTVTIGQEGQDETEHEDEISEAEEILTKSGGVINYQRINAISLPEIAESNWSYIGDQKIYVTVLNAADIRYQAVFEKNGTAYEMTGTNVTQKEFIDELYRRVKKVRK